MITDSKSKTKKAPSKRNNSVSNLSIERRQSSNVTETDVSVITKTTNPKVLIQSESLDNNICTKHQLLRFICMIVMCMIILLTFFVSIKTYGLVQELSNYII